MLELSVRDNYITYIYTITSHSQARDGAWDEVKPRVTIDKLLSWQVDLAEDNLLAVDFEGVVELEWRRECIMRSISLCTPDGGHLSARVPAVM